MLTSLAYIGPGAGVALLGSFLVLTLAVLSALFVLVTWPVRVLWRTIRGRRALRNARTPRVVVLGLDGLDPELTERHMSEGLLPNLAKLRDGGTYTRLGTSWPPLSPVAWSCFATGANPGKHNIFDFLSRSPADYSPRLSSVRIEEPRRALRLGPWRVPLGHSSIRGLRGSKPFWSVLGEHGVFSAILRVPITFPPEPFFGVQLSAMSVPDLLGSQGTFTAFTDADENAAIEADETWGLRRRVERQGDVIRSYLQGPPNPWRADRLELRVPFVVRKDRKGRAVMRIGGESVVLKLAEHTPWVKVAFRLTPWSKLRGICRFYLKRFDERFELYCTPVQIDPERPAMPISHPRVYATYLAKLLGPYATLGLAEDTGALSAGVLDEAAFVEQAYLVHAEREAMFVDALRRVRRGAVVCVFDAPDRIQHMCWRESDAAVRAMYQRMDELVGRTIAALGKRDVLLVMSDHGFKPFRRGVDLNAWLRANGYLHLKGDAAATDRAYLADVDWSRTRAYALGLSGIYLNRRGREAHGIVGDREVAAIVLELKAKLTGLREDERGETAIREAVAREDVYRGPYIDAAPDVIVGYNAGYRVSWDAAVGRCGPQVFADNTKPWSGDHCMHPDVVPGVLFSNAKLSAGEGAARLVDLAPTVLDLLGVAKPAYMDGRSLCDTSR